MPRNIKNFIEEFYPEDNIILYDGLDEALVGVVQGFDSIPKACYSYRKCIEIISRDMEDDPDIEDKYMEAIEHFHFNVRGSYVGRATPVFLQEI